ncbi:MAG: GAF and ANTAR domain-containing protein [Propionibacteriaceae bacterium]|nr:GAF and ANTAR domain-containing protein [Propionibacteriaceae bacterium]
MGTWAGHSLEESGEFARNVAEGQGETERLNLGVALVVELVDGCDHAGITRVSREGAETVAASSDKARLCDQLQYDLGEGPCLDTVRTHQTVVSNSLGSDPRWPRWGPAVARLYGVGSLLSLLLYTHGDSYGALNLYAERPGAYCSDDLVVAQSLAAHLAVALAGGREIDHRAVAMVNRTVIGQAEGILMERFKITADQAFELLRDSSVKTNNRLIQVAEELTRTGQWSTPPAAGGEPT